jgi:cell division transport system permease protein
MAANATISGVHNGSANGNGNGKTNGAWRPPESLAPLAAANGAVNGRSKRGGGLRLRARLNRVAQITLGYQPPPARARSRPSLSAGERIGKVMQFVLGYTAPPRPEKPKQAAAGARRWPWTSAVNLLRLAVGGAASTWIRNFRTVAPALGSITLLLLLAGVLSLSGFAVRSLLVSQSAEASVLHVYLSDDATGDQVDQARQELTAQPHVRGVKYIDKDQALADARRRPGLADLASLSDSNPFPASLEVTVDSPSNVATVAKAAANEPGVDTHQATSYDPDTYNRLRQVTIVGVGVAGGFGLLLLAITYVISSNSIRAAVLARRDELLTMQLVGASPWLIRTRLAVEGALTGGLAAVLAVAVVAGVSVAALYGARHLFVQVLPGVTAGSAVEASLAVAALGIALGSVSALFAFRRLRT